MSCPEPYVLTDNDCILDCESEQFFNFSTHLCHTCDSTCLTCNGSESTNCSSCSDGFFLNENSSC